MVRQGSSDSSPFFPNERHFFPLGGNLREKQSRDSRLSDDGIHQLAQVLGKISWASPGSITVHGYKHTPFASEYIGRKSASSARDLCWRRGKNFHELGSCWRKSIDGV